MSQPAPSIPLVAAVGARYESLTVDSRLINCIAEKGADEAYHVYKRAGFTSIALLAVGTGNGCYYWNGYFYAIVGTAIFKLTTPPLVPVFIIGTVAAGGKYYFTSCLGATPVLFLSNGTNAYTIDAADTVTEVTAAITAQAGFPASLTWIPSVVSIDGYVTLADKSSNVWTATLNLPGTWPGNVGIAQLEPDFPVALAKQISYLLCIKQFYTEAFYDAAATPWPYARVDGAKMNYGCIDGRTVCDVGGDVMWVAQTREGGGMVVLVTSLRATLVSTPSIERILRAADYSGNVYSWAAKISGHRLYGVTIVNSNLTLVYDLTSQLWYQWTDTNGNYLPYSCATVGTKNDVVFQHESNGELYTTSVAVFNDNSELFSVDIYTPNFDGGTRRTKALTKLSLFGDQVNASSVQLRYSDDDYQTWTDAGTADLSTDDPFWVDLGSFKKRAFRLTHRADTAFRVEKAEPTISVGQL